MKNISCNKSPLLQLLLSFIPYLTYSGGVHLKLEDNISLINELIQSGIDVYLMHLDNESEIRRIIKNTLIHICDD